MRAATVVLLGVMVLAAGCLYAPPSRTVTKYTEENYYVRLPSPYPPETRGPDQFFVVHLLGAEGVERIRGDDEDNRFDCPSSRPDYSLNAGAETLRVNRGRYAMDAVNVTIVVILEYHRVDVQPGGVHDGCGTLQELHSFVGSAHLQRALRPDVPLDLHVEPIGGLFRYLDPEENAYYVPMGTKLHVNLTRVERTEAATYFLSGDFEVANLGAWDRANLTFYGAPPRS